MIKNDLKIAWRTLLKNKLFSFVNISGLSIGLAACLAVATLVLDDLSYDTHWENHQNIHRVLSINPYNTLAVEKSASSFAGLEFALPENFPEVKTLTSIYSSTANFSIDEDKSIIAKTPILRTSPKIWDVLNFDVLLGEPQKFIAGKTNLVITKSFRKKYFPTINPVGKILTNLPSYGAKASEYLITGVIEDLPANTHLRAQAITINKSRIEELAKQQYGTFKQLYIVTKPGTNMSLLASKVNKWYADFVEGDKIYQFEFQPIEDVYLYSEFENSQDVKGDITTIYILSVIAILLLIIACINFINMSTSRNLNRVKEVSLRKVQGATNAIITRQFIIESLMFFIIAILIATCLYYIAIPVLEAYIGHSLEITFIQNLELLFISYGIFIMVGTLTGLYPAFLMSKLKMIDSLKGKIKSGKLSYQTLIQRGLLTFQFVITVFVLMGLIVVQQQINYVNQKDLGFKSENLLSISNISWDNKGSTFKKLLLEIPGIESASITSFLPGTGSIYMTKPVSDPLNKENKIKVGFIKGDVDLPKTLGLELKEGRFFDKNRPIDAPISTNGYSFNEKDKKADRRSSLISQSTASQLGIKQLNQLIPEAETQPIGIVKDFHVNSLKDHMTPNIIIAESEPKYGGMLLRISPQRINQSLGALQTLWKEIYEVKLLDLNWVDETLIAQYEKEARLRTFFTFFSLLCMLLSVLGMIGLIAQATAVRMKEVGIRKMLGASVSSLVLLFTKKLIRIVLLATLIAIPISYYFLNEWLQGFAYRISITWWMFLIAGGSVICVAFLTTGIQSLKAAIVNPVNSIKTE